MSTTIKQMVHERSEYNKIYYEQNKEYFTKKYICDCSGSYNMTSRSRHNKCKKHIKYVDSLNKKIDL